MEKQTTSIVLFGKKITTVTDTTMSSGEQSTVRTPYVDKNCFKRRGETSTGQKTITIQYYWINPILELPSTIKNAIDRACGCGHDLVFLLGMELDEYDVDLMDQDHRVYIPKSECLMNYLTEEEKREIVKEGWDGGLDVLGFGAKAEMNNFKLMLFPNPENDLFVLKKKWAMLDVGENGPDKSTVLELWCFRNGSGALCVALNTEKRALFDFRITGGRGGARIGGA